MIARTKLPTIHIRDTSKQWVPHQRTRAENLFNEMTFYPAFTKDLLGAKREVIIYSPFVSKYRSDTFNRLIYKLSKTNTDIFIFTRPVEEYDRGQQSQARKVLDHYQEMGAQVFYLKGSIHEKVAIIDREILWEGSLNILSQRTSREMMRRITGEDSAMEVIRYLGLNRTLAEGYRLKYERLYRGLMEGERKSRRFGRRTVALGLTVMVAAWWIILAVSAMIPAKSADMIWNLVQALASRH